MTTTPNGPTTESGLPIRDPGATLRNTPTFTVAFMVGEVISCDDVIEILADLARCSLCGGLVLLGSDSSGAHAAWHRALGR